MGKPLNMVDETKIVALLSRGDTYKEIVAAFTDRPMTERTISAVKKRNKKNLAIIRQHAAEKAEEDAGAIKDKANKKISQRLDDDEKSKQVLRKAREAVLAGEIDWKDYKEILRRHKELSVPELVGVSKEMHSQSVKGNDDPPASGDLAALTAAIKSGDEIEVTRILFNGKSTPPEEELQRPLPPSGN